MGWHNEMICEAMAENAAARERKATEERRKLPAKVCVVRSDGTQVIGRMPRDQYNSWVDSTAVVFEGETYVKECNSDHRVFEAIFHVAKVGTFTPDSPSPIEGEKP